MSDCCLTPNEQYEELDIYKNSGRPYNNTNFDKEDILANHKSFMSWLSIPINEEKLRIIYFICEYDTRNNNVHEFETRNNNVHEYETRNNNVHEYETDI